MEPDRVMAEVQNVLRNRGSHWVGDGFPVRTLFFYEQQGQELSPFLMLDYAGPHEFPPTGARRGVGPHPHRGFETVTIVYSGEVEHRDSSGGGGQIGPGDVQWMTAASGLVHEEFHGRDFAKQGGKFEVAQLWVNLPAADKMTAPRYQPITSAEIPSGKLGGGVGTVRVIAGEYEGLKGPAQTFTPMNVWDLRLNSAQAVDLLLPPGHTKLLVVLRGSAELSGGTTLGEAEVALLDREGEYLRIEHAEDVTALVLSGQPLGEPIVGYGPFVMNTTLEIHEAIDDYQNGRLGVLS